MTETKQNIPVITIIRNGISKVLTAITFGKKSDNKGKTYWYPEIDVRSPDDVLYVGVDEINSMLNKVLKTMHGSIFSDNVDEVTGIFNQAAFEADVAEFTAGADKLSDIKDELEELSDFLFQCMNSPHFVEAFTEAPKSADALELRDNMLRAKDRQELLRGKKTFLEVKYGERIAKRAANKAKREADEAAKKLEQPVTA